MNIIGVSYKRDVQNAEWKSIQPLQCERKQGSLTGTNLSEGKGWTVGKLHMCKVRSLRQ